MYGFVRGEISPFRLVRMTQKDMQAIKAPETTEKKHLGVNVIKAKPLMRAKAGGLFKCVCAFFLFPVSRVRMLLLLLLLWLKSQVRCQNQKR